MKVITKFRGRTAKITVKKPRSKNGWITATYPCGSTQSYGDMAIYNQYSERDINKHLFKCLACKIALGLSKAKVLQSQQQVANLFGIGKDGFNANGVESKEGFLTYYGNIRAVRTAKGIIVNSQLDFIRSGYSGVHVPKPEVNVIAEIPLGTTRQITNNSNFEWMREIKVLNQDRKGFWNRNILIIANDKKLLITRDKNRSQYVIELPLTCGTTVKDAFNCLKPFIVQKYEELGVKVQRQGEFYFVPRQHVKDSEVKKIIGVIRHKEIEHTYDYSTTDGVTGDIQRVERVGTTLIFPSVDNKEDTHHRATRHGFYKGLNVVKGTVRHTNRDHKLLKLPKNIWCIVAKNTAINSLNVTTGDPD